MWGPPDRTLRSGSAQSCRFVTAGVVGRSVSVATQPRRGRDEPTREPLRAADPRWVLDGDGEGSKEARRRPIEALGREGSGVDPFRRSFIEGVAIAAIGLPIASGGATAHGLPDDTPGRGPDGSGNGNEDGNDESDESNESNENNESEEEGEGDEDSEDDGDDESEGDGGDEDGGSFEDVTFAPETDPSDLTGKNRGQLVASIPPLTKRKIGRVDLFAPLNVLEGRQDNDVPEPGENGLVFYERIADDVRFEIEVNDAEDLEGLPVTRPSRPAGRIRQLAVRLPVRLRDPRRFVGRPARPIG
jgi:hypothetical protein